MKRVLNLAWQFPFWLAALAVIPSASPAAETVLLENVIFKDIPVYDAPAFIADESLLLPAPGTVSR